MNWKFWQKSQPAEGKPVMENLPRPKELPSQVGQYLVVKLQKDPNWVWSLRCTNRPRQGHKNIVDFRVFDKYQIDAKNVKIRDYNSFEEHSGLILFEGWYDKNSDQIVVTDKQAKEKMRDAA